MKTRILTIAFLLATLLSCRKENESHNITVYLYHHTDVVRLSKGTITYNNDEKGEPDLTLSSNALNGSIIFQEVPSGEHFIEAYGVIGEDTIRESKVFRTGSMDEYTLYLGRVIVLTEHHH